MFVFKYIRNRFEIGFYETRQEPGGGPWQAWVPVAYTASSRIAAEFVNYLHGGRDIGDHIDQIHFWSLG